MVFGLCNSFPSIPWRRGQWPKPLNWMNLESHAFQKREQYGSESKISLLFVVFLQEYRIQNSPVGFCFCVCFEHPSALGACEREQREERKNLKPISINESFFLFIKITVTYSNLCDPTSVPHQQAQLMSLNVCLYFFKKICCVMQYQSVLQNTQQKIIMGWQSLSLFFHQENVTVCNTQ